ncbi:DUF1853 family protein [Verrucomicrobiales bacterium]|nr:DUF1853 family protein [Verrucomicrobiales bacterium]
MSPTNFQQIARDLDWVLRTPFLLKGQPSISPPAPGSAIFESDAFLEFFVAAPRSHRVGYYFESLVHFWLKEIRGVEIVEHNLQIQDGKRTVGELDFVFRDENGELNHWEVAIKFYLHAATENYSGSHFVGPNARDTLERKHARFIDHQLPLGKATIPEIAHQATFVKGQIFYHPTDRDPVISPLLAENHQRGFWFRQSETDLLENFQGAESFRILQKPSWLSGSSAAAVNYASISDWLKTHFTESDHPVLLSALDSTETETARIFVVNDRWPAID